MGRTTLSPADLPREPGEAEPWTRQCPRLQQSDDGQEHHKTGAAVDVAARYRPPLPAQPSCGRRAGDGVDEGPQQERDDDDRRDDDGHEQLRTKLDELEKEEEV